MKTERQQEINQLIDRVLYGLTDQERSTVNALCRASYNMGVDDGKQNSMLEIVGADTLITALNNNER